MKLLFIQGGTRLKNDTESKWYTDGNLNNKVWQRYKSYCDELLIVLRKEDKVYDINHCKENFNEMDMKKIKLFPVYDLMRPKKRFFSLKYRKMVRDEIEKAVIECDKAIIRSAHNFYTLTAVNMCKKHKKDYLIEVAGYAFDGYWRHGTIFGKIVAIPYEILAKKAMRDTKYCVYVTNESLQKSYPCKYNTLGCSDVELNALDEKDLENKIKLLESKKEKIVLGTIGSVDLKLKGQHIVIEALHKLKNKGIDNFEYQLVGLGDSKYIDSLVKKYDLQKNVKIVGAMPHDEIFEWLENLDVYIQPSFQEGLCRAVVEAMSKACPIIVSNVGGNPELANPKYTFKRGNNKQLAGILEKLTTDSLVDEAKRSFSKAKEYDKSILDKKRDGFYQKFILNDGEK